MSKIEDGGQAFPCLERGGNGLELTDGGMTLRDYFAAKAMQANRSRTSVYSSWDDLAKDAYELADAMLRAREQS